MHFKLSYIPFLKKNTQEYNIYDLSPLLTIWCISLNIKKIS